MKLTADLVGKLFLDCLFKEGEDTTKRVVVVKGITVIVGLHPERLESKRAEVRELLRELDEAFFPATGGGMSFLKMPFRNDTVHWGEHRSAEQLMMLALGLGEAEYLMPREMWPAFPCGMPYLVFKD